MNTDEDTVLSVTAAALQANDGVASASPIVDVSTTAVDSSGTVYGAITHSGGTGYDNITFTPQCHGRCAGGG